MAEPEPQRRRTATRVLIHWLCITISRRLRMKRFLALTALTLMLGGCAVQPILLNDRAPESYEIPVKTMIVDNLATETKVRPSDIIYVNGWAPIHHVGFEPPLHEAFVSKMRNSIVANGTSGRIDISVLRVGFFVYKIVADDIVFVNFFMLGREKRLKCDVDINVKTESDSRRITLTHEFRRSPFDDQEKHNSLESPLESCQTDLIRQIADLIKGTV